MGQLARFQPQVLGTVAVVGSPPAWWWGAHQVTTQVELSLARKGLKPGADGFELLEQMERMAGALDAAEREPLSPAHKVA